jgi:hypothetical protein
MTKDTTMPAKSDTSDTSRDKMNSEPEGYPNLPSEVHAAGSVLLQGSGRKRVSRAERKGVDSPSRQSARNAGSVWAVTLTVWPAHP